MLAFVAFTTDMGAGRTLTDTRSLDEDGAAIKMELELTTPDATIALTRIPGTAPGPSAVPSLGTNSLGIGAFSS